VFANAPARAAPLAGKFSIAVILQNPTTSRQYACLQRLVPEPACSLEFVTAYRCTELQIVAHILAQEKIVVPAGDTPGVRELTAMHVLAPVRYTGDESEANTIGWRVLVHHPKRACIN
jgi:hypothetical protein